MIFIKNSTFCNVDIYFILHISNLLLTILFIMNNINNKQEYWKNRKLYRVLKDDTVSLYFLCWICYISLQFTCSITILLLQYIRNVIHIFVDQHAGHPAIYWNVRNQKRWKIFELPVWSWFGTYIYSYKW